MERFYVKLNVLEISCNSLRGGFEIKGPNWRFTFFQMKFRVEMHAVIFLCYSLPQRLEGNKSSVFVDGSSCVAAVAHRNF